MAYTVTNEYLETIYSGETNNKITISFGGIEVENANSYVERLTIKSRVLPNGSNRFSIENFISKELELVMHNFDESSIIDQVSISIGTLVGEDYEYVPIGIFNIQDKPKTDKDRITISLRDNSVKFDFNYNAKPLLDGNDGVATKKEILDNICQQFGVVNGVTSFLGEDDEIGIYDSTIRARTYISYIAGQAGRIPVIDRTGKLIFIDILNLHTWEVSENVVEKFENDIKYKISKTIYESGIIKYESGDETNNILYLNANNPYISSQTQLESIHGLVDGFEIDSFKTGKVLGNPAIDPWDLILINYNDVDYKTLATNTLTFSKVMMQTFDTQISISKVNSNNSNMGDAAFKKYAKTSIDNINAQLEITVGQVSEQQEQITTTVQTVSTLTDTVENNKYFTDIDGNRNLMSSSLLEVERSINGLDVKMTQVGGSNLIKNSVAYFNTDWENIMPSYTDTEIKQNTVLSKNCFLLSDGTMTQNIQVPNGVYSISFKYKKILELATCSIKINDYEIEMDSTNWSNENYVFNVLSNNIKIEVISDNDGSCYLTDLMCNYGSIIQVWSSALGESVNGGVKIGSSIEIETNASNIKQVINNDGNRIINTITNAVVAEYTDKGLTTNEINANKGKIAKLLIQDLVSRNQTLISRL